MGERQFELTPEQFRADWVRALRSGEYRQGRGQLGQIVDGRAFYCCLGVACERYIALGGVLSRTERGGGGVDYSDTHETNSYYLPPVVAAALDITQKGYLVDSRHGIALTHLNDVREFSFDVIADEIERGNVRLIQTDEDEDKEV